jgi:hypothetical protein
MPNDVFIKVAVELPWGVAACPALFLRHFYGSKAFLHEMIDDYGDEYRWGDFDHLRSLGSMGLTCKTKVNVLVVR